MLQGHQDRHDDGLLVRLVDIHAVFVVDGDQLLADHRDDFVLGVVQLEVQFGDVAPAAPSPVLRCS